MGKKSRVGLPWCVEEENMVRGMFNDGYPMDAIVMATKRSPSGIATRLQRMGLLYRDDNRLYKPKHVWYTLTEEHPKNG